MREWGTPGVYVLLTDNGSGQVYVGAGRPSRESGCSNTGASRNSSGVVQSSIKRDTSHGFNSAEIGYLEGRLSAEIGAIPGVDSHRGT